MTLTYTKYLRIDELLALQKPMSDGPEHDEMLFIVIHQVFELWFKQVLHEFTLLKKSFLKNEAATGMATLKRVLTILKTIVAQIDVLETMTPLQFKSFRDRLETASGFQSVQFRLLEIALGKKNIQFIDKLPLEDSDKQKMRVAAQEPSLYEYFLKFLNLNGCKVPEKSTEANPAVQDVLLDIYRTRPDLMRVCELLTDMDEGIQEWRYRHVKMVERTIGNKMGTGGTGVDYLKSTLFKPLFPDLWAIRDRF